LHDCVDDERAQGVLIDVVLLPALSLKKIMIFHNLASSFLLQCAVHGPEVTLDSIIAGRS